MVEKTLNVQINQYFQKAVMIKIQLCHRIAEKKYSNLTITQKMI